MIKTSDKCHSLNSEYSLGSSALSVCLSICIVLNPILHINHNFILQCLHCLCLSICIVYVSLSCLFRLNALSVRLSCLMPNNLSCLSICLILLSVYLYFQCWSICVVNVSLSNLFFLNVMSVYLSCLSICIFSLSAWLVHGFKRVMVKSH